jgi:hypothetical protein
MDTVKLFGLENRSKVDNAVLFDWFFMFLVRWEIYSFGQMPYEVGFRKRDLLLKLRRQVHVHSLNTASKTGFTLVQCCEVFAELFGQSRRKIWPLRKKILSHSNIHFFRRNLGLRKTQFFVSVSEKIIIFLELS